MVKSIANELHRINYLNAEMNALYHQASRRIGLADSEMTILYVLYDQGGSCMLGDIYQQSGISKQTINSALRKLEAEQAIRLEQYTGRSKRVVLTPIGEELSQKTAARVFQAESNAFSSWTEEEIHAHIHNLERYIASFREEVERL